MLQEGLFSYSDMGRMINRPLNCRDRLAADHITRPIAEWSVEADALWKKGMPLSSYTLMLDGEPLPAKTSQIFRRVVLRDAAWHEALETRFGGSGLDTVLKMRSNLRYAFRRFPELLREMREGRGLVRCDFEMGEP